MFENLCLVFSFSFFSIVIFIQYVYVFPLSWHVLGHKVKINVMLSVVSYLDERFFFLLMDRIYTFFFFFTLNLIFIDTAVRGECECVATTALGPNNGSVAVNLAPNSPSDHHPTSTWGNVLEQSSRTQRQTHMEWDWLLDNPLTIWTTVTVNHFTFQCSFLPYCGTYIDADSSEQCTWIHHGLKAKTTKAIFKPDVLIFIDFLSLLSFFFSAHWNTEAGNLDDFYWQS